MRQRLLRHLFLVFLFIAHASFASNHSKIGIHDKHHPNETITAFNPNPPTGATNQFFCVIDMPTVSQLSAVGTNIQWYEGLNTTTPLSINDFLINGEDYFATQTVSGVESPNRLQVIVFMDDPTAPLGGATQQFCAVDSPNVIDLQATGTNIQWYESLTSTNPLTTNVALVHGEDYFATQTVGGCESTQRLSVTVTVLDSPVPIGSAIQTFCSVDDPTVESLVISGTNVEWYVDATSTTPLFPIVALETGQDYFATQNINGCESSQRFQVVITLDDPPPPSGTLTQTFCAVDNPTISSLDVVGTSVKWYSDPTTNVELLPNVSLTNGSDYFATQTLNGCESDTRLQVIVSLENPPAPTGPNLVSFCAVNNPLIGNLQAVGLNLQIYEDPVSITPLNPIDLLVDGQDYYLTQTVNGCESVNRLQINVTLFDPDAPIINNNFQSFCLNDVPTLDDIDVQGFNIQWYDDQFSTTPLPNTTQLVDGEDYYATQTENGCESDTRSVVVITINDSTPPTTADPIQYFCTQDNPTVSDLSANGLAIVWYPDATSDIALPNNTVLVDGEDYYATQTSLGCESSQRLQVDVELTISPNNILPVNAVDVALCGENSTDIVVLNSDLFVTYQLVNSTNGLPVGLPVAGNGGSITLPTGTISSNSFFQVIATSDENSACSVPLLGQVTVVVDADPTIAAAGVDQILCNETSTSLLANFAAIGNGVWSQISGPSQASISDVNINNPLVTNLVSGTYTFLWEISNGACSGAFASNDIVEVEVFNIQGLITPTATTTVGGSDGSIEICMSGGLAPYTISWAPSSVGTLNSVTSAVCSDLFEITGLPTGVYSLTVGDDNGCVITLPDVTVGEPDCSDLVISSITSTAVSCFGGTDGSMTVSILNGQGDMTIDIGNGSTPLVTNAAINIIDNLDAGEYIVSVTDERLCTFTFSQPITITEADTLEVNPVVVHPSEVGFSDGVICVNPSGGTAPYTVNATCGTVLQGTSTCGFDFYIENLPSGPCTIEVTDANGCTSTETVQLEDPLCDIFTFASVIAEDVLCNGDADGSIEISLNNGIAPFQYSIDGGVTFETDNSNIYLFENLNVGTYNVTVIDATDCTIDFASDVIINEPNSPLEVDTTSGVGGAGFTLVNDCFGNGTGSISPGVIGGTPDYTYEWSNGTTDLINTGLLAGDYTLTVTDANGCTATSMMTIENAAEFTVEIAVDGTVSTSAEIVVGSSVELSVVTDAINPTFVWSPSTGLSSTTDQTVTATPEETTEYMVIVTSEDGCEVMVLFEVRVIEEDNIVIPNSFSPNGDGHNDDFFPIYQGTVSVNELRIYNRWGQLIHDNPTIPWDGKYKGKDQPVDAYVYVISYETATESSIMVSGDILIVR